MPTEQHGEYETGNRNGDAYGHGEDLRCEQPGRKGCERATPCSHGYVFMGEATKVSVHLLRSANNGFRRPRGEQSCLSCTSHDICRAEMALH